MFALQGCLGADQDRVCCASVSEMGVHKTQGCLAGSPEGQGKSQGSTKRIHVIGITVGFLGVLSHVTRVLPEGFG